MKILFNTQTQKLVSWPRIDTESVIGLSNTLIEMEIIKNPLPNYNPYTQKLIRHQVVNFEKKTINITYDVENLETPFDLKPNNSLETSIPLI
jgi:hypothetical protein